jgi:hypothetical protein
MRPGGLLLLRIVLPVKAPFLLLILAASAHAQADAGALAPPRQVIVVAVPEKVQLGEPFVVQAVITHDKGQRIDLRTPGDLGDFDLVESRRSRIDGPETSTTTFDLKLSAFAMGKQKTPDFTFEVFEGAVYGTFVASGTRIEVLSTLPADVAEKGAGLFDVRPPEEVPIRTWRLLILLGALLAAGALGYALLKSLRRPKRLTPLIAKAPEALHVRTIASLDALRALDLPGKGRSREFYFLLSEVLRSYLGERYAFEARESTSSELLDIIRRLHTPGLQLNELTGFVIESDLAKFAKATPTPDECKASIAFAYRVVYATTPALVPPAPADAKRPAQLS